MLPRLRLAPFAAAALAFGAGSVLAQSSPYYLGVAQSLSYDSNLYRIGGNSALPIQAQSKSDTVSSTSLVAGIDQSWGRQRLSGSGAFRVNRYAQNDQLNYQGYSLNLGLDWATVERVSGRLAVTADRSLRSYDPAVQGGSIVRNIEDNTSAVATVRVGVVTRLTAEGTLSRRQIRYSAQGFAGAEYNQDIVSLGARYRLGGAATVGLAWRQTDLRSVSINNPSKRRDMDLTASWDPSGLTTVYARISHTAADYARSPVQDFSGVTGELRGSTQLTGKIKLNTRLARDLGQSYSALDFQVQTPAFEFSRISTSMRISADYELTSKIALNASIEHVRRSFDGAAIALSGSDRTTTLDIGARWLPTRAIQVGCGLNHAGRSVDVVGNPYSSTGVNCYGQFIIQ